MKNIDKIITSEFSTVSVINAIENVEDTYSDMIESFAPKDKQEELEEKINLYVSKISKVAFKQGFVRGIANVMESVGSMTALEKENLFISIEANIDKAEHIAEKIISEYELDLPNPDDTDNLLFAGNRNKIWTDMDILLDYIRLIRAGKENLEKAVMI